MVEKYYSEILSKYNNNEYFINIINEGIDNLTKCEAKSLLNNIYRLDETILLYLLLNSMIDENQFRRDIIIEFLNEHPISLDIINSLAKPDKNIIEHTEELIKCAKTLLKFEYISDDLYRPLITACVYHDIGKTNSAFQKRISEKTKFNEENEIYHNIISFRLINKSFFKTKEEYYLTSFLVLNHHHYIDNFNYLSEQKEKMEEILYETVPEEYINKINNNLLIKIKKQQSALNNIKLLGLLYKCDYAASSSSTIEYENDFLENNLNNLIENWKKDNPHANWNTMQLFCKDNKDENIIVTASTGMGKTEGALNWIGDNKAFFFLPLKSAINAMFLRIKDIILNNEHIDNRLSLLHSDTLSIYTRFNKELDISNYYNETKQFSLPLTISTIDQLFDFIFLYPGYELKFATLSYSKIVIDEIQMYDPELLAYLISGLEKLNDIGAKIAIVTATLPPFIKDMLTKKILFQSNTFANKMQRHNVKVIDSKLSSADIFKFYKTKGKNKKTLVICNTVKKSQQIFNDLKNKYHLDNVRLLHSKYTKKDRKILEQDILNDGQTECEKDIIWIATQIVEASLDIDFDYGFSELSELSALFQRMGRINRKGKKIISEYNFFVYTIIDESLVGKVVDETLFNLSKIALQSVDGILDEESKFTLIDKYFTTENIKHSKYYSKYLKAKQYIDTLNSYEIDKSEVDLRKIEAYSVIPLCVYEDNQLIIDQLVDEYKESTNKIEKNRILNEINEYSLSVRKYEKQEKGKSYIVDSIELSEYLFIDILDCEYDNEIGFQKKKKEVEIFL